MLCLTGILILFHNQPQSIKDKNYNNQFLTEDHCPISSKYSTRETNWLADLLSGNIVHDIFVIYGNQSIKNFWFQVIISQCKI